MLKGKRLPNSFWAKDVKAICLEQTTNQISGNEGSRRAWLCSVTPIFAWVFTQVVMKFHEAANEVGSLDGEEFSVKIPWMCGMLDFELGPYLKIEATLKVFNNSRHYSGLNSNQWQ